MQSQPPVLGKEVNDSEHLHNSQLPALGREVNRYLYRMFCILHLAVYIYHSMARITSRDNKCLVSYHIVSAIVSHHHSAAAECIDTSYVSDAPYRDSHCVL